MGLTIKTDEKPVMVFRKDKEYNGSTFPTYSIGVSSKDKDGNWISAYYDCLFKKGVEVENKTKIFIKNAFPVVSKGKEDRNYPKFMITDFEIEGQSSDGFMNVPDTIDEEVPWS